MTLPLTARQHELLRFIESCERSPSLEEMRAALGWKSRSQVSKVLGALEARGFIRRSPRLARSVVPVRPRDGAGGCEPPLGKAASSALLAELERRGILLTGIVR